MPAIPQQRIRGQSRPPLLVKWNWAQKPLENPLCGFNISEGQLPGSLVSVTFLQHWQGGMTGLDPLPLSPCGSLTPSQQWKGCSTLNSADLARWSRTVYSTMGLISLLTTRSALGSCQHIPLKPHKAAPALQQPHSCKQAEPGAYIKLSHS